MDSEAYGRAQEWGGYSQSPVPEIEVPDEEVEIGIDSPQDPVRLSCCSEDLFQGLQEQSTTSVQESTEPLSSIHESIAGEFPIGNSAARRARDAEWFKSDPEPELSYSEMLHHGNITGRQANEEAMEENENSSAGTLKRSEDGDASVYSWVGEKPLQEFCTGNKVHHSVEDDLTVANSDIESDNSATYQEPYEEFAAADDTRPVEDKYFNEKCVRDSVKKCGENRVGNEEVTESAIDLKAGQCQLHAEETSAQPLVISTNKSYPDTPTRSNVVSEVSRAQESACFTGNGLYNTKYEEQLERPYHAIRRQISLSGDSSQGNAFQAREADPKVSGKFERFSGKFLMGSASLCQTLPRRSAVRQSRRSRSQAQFTWKGFDRVLRDPENKFRDAAFCRYLDIPNFDERIRDYISRESRIEEPVPGFDDVLDELLAGAEAGGVYNEAELLTWLKASLQGYMREGMGEASAFDAALADIAAALQERRPLGGGPKRPPAALAGRALRGKGWTEQRRDRRHRRPRSAPELQGALTEHDCAMALRDAQRRLLSLQTAPICVLRSVPTSRMRRFCHEAVDELSDAAARLEPRMRELHADGGRHALREQLVRGRSRFRKVLRACEDGGGTPEPSDEGFWRTLQGCDGELADEVDWNAVKKTHRMFQQWMHTQPSDTS